MRTLHYRPSGSGSSSAVTEFYTGLGYEAIGTVPETE